MSRSILSRIAVRPKAALAGAVFAATTAVSVLGVTATSAAAAPAAAPTVAEAASAKAIAKKMIKNEAQFTCFSKIVQHESNWDVNAQNASSGAYGLVQALPGGKMATAGADWQTNPETQIEWGLDYMKERYGSPCDAWSAWQAQGWY